MFVLHTIAIKVYHRLVFATELFHILMNIKVDLDIVQILQELVSGFILFSQSKKSITESKLLKLIITSQFFCNKGFAL